jgi:hypothetical protein
MDAKITALVIIITAITLSSGVLLFQCLNTNTSNANQAEKLEITDSAVWYKNTWAYAQAAIIIVNDGKTEAIINKISVRGIRCSWSDIYYSKGEIGSFSNLNPSSEELSGTSVNIVVDNKEQMFLQATGPLALRSFETIVFYVKNPGNITLGDIPATVTVAIYTENDLYYKETDVEAQIDIGFMGSSSVQITDATFPDASHVTLAVKNTGTKTVTLAAAKINGGQSITISETLQPRNSTTIDLDLAWVAGNPYKFNLYDSSGIIVGSYQATPPA